MSDEAEAKGRLTKTFTKMYPLDPVSELGKKGRKIAMDPKLCKNYVLKPQREGGGHNVYKEDIPKYLSQTRREGLGFLCSNGTY